MGQYLKDRKIGTYNSMYYMRLEEAQERAQRGEADDDGIKFSEYLADNDTRWRFPFPDEDQGLPADARYDKGFDLPAGIPNEVQHGHFWVSNEHKNGGHGMNIKLPCPHSEEFGALGLKVSLGGAREQFVTVRYQALRKDDESASEFKEKTIFACARCGQEQFFSDAAIAALKRRALAYFKHYGGNGDAGGSAANQGLQNYAIEIIKRIK